MPKQTASTGLPRVIQTIPAVVNTVPEPRVTVIDRQPSATRPHLIPDDNNTFPTVSHQPQHTHKGSHIIPDIYHGDATQKYLHKYNTRSAARYAFAAATLHAQQF